MRAILSELVLEERFDGISAASRLCLFFNDVFDSFNASDFCSENASPDLRKPVTKCSAHMEIWNCALDVFDSMHILIPKNEVENADGKRSSIARAY